MNRPFAAAIVATFRDAEPAQHRARLQQFTGRTWERNFHWLDASGLALYFLQRLRNLNLENAVPGAVLSQLERRQVENKLRTGSLFEEFVRINEEFRRANTRYVALKGFTLVPDYCPDPSLRCQMDFDFLIGSTDAGRCTEILGALGYNPIANSGYVMEFKTASARPPRIDDLYKPRPERSVELHICDDSRTYTQSSLIENARSIGANGHSYPALSVEDMFLSQTWHLFRHLRSEWTRVSWLVEFRHFVASRQTDLDFWQRIAARLASDPDTTIAVGSVAKLADKAFGRFSPDPVTTWAVTQLPRDVGLWIDHFGDQVLCADFPGSKLYLLLERALDANSAPALVRRRLFPRHAPPAVVLPKSKSLLAKLAAGGARSKYFCFRLRFHLRAGARYFIESWRWNRLSKVGNAAAAYIPAIGPLRPPIR